MPSAPLGPTSQLRKKQKTYHHTELSVSFDDNKENRDSEVLPGLPPTHLKTYDSATEKDDGLPKVAFPYPATPANKIPLDDLVGNTEDAFNRPTAAATPNDCVTWQHGPRSSDSASSSHTTQRHYKRARSSSPSSSQLEKSNHFSAQKDFLNLESMQKSLRTPQNDPSVDLWNRYASGDISKSIHQESVVSGLARLLPSSPQTPSTADSREKSLRRVVSCGVQWPMTETKKRKTSPKTYGRVKDLFAASKRQILGQELPRSGRVSVLLDKIQESLSRKPSNEVDQDAEAPSSSSPIPDGDTETEAWRNRPEPDLPPLPAIVQGDGMLGAEGATGEQAKGLSVRAESSSDYGGDDIDYELFEQVEFAATQAMANAAKQKTLSKLEGNIANEVIMPLKPPWVAPNAKPSQPPQSAFAPEHEQTNAKKEVEEAKDEAKEEMSDDEYGLDDPDFADELGDLCAQYESQDKQDAPVKQSFDVTETTKQEIGQALTVQQISPDEFDDPFGDDVWKDIADGSIVSQKFDAVGSTSQVCGTR